MHQYQRASVFENRRGSLHAWQEWVRNPSLTVLLVLELCLIFLAAEWPLVASTVLRRGGTMLTFAALTWVVSHAVYAPGRITFHRLQGAAVVYLNLATIFAATFSLIWELSPLAFANLP
jgi:hypothetical protein